MYLLIGVGYFLGKCKFLKEQDIGTLSKFMMNVSMIGAILSGMNISYNPERVQLIFFSIFFQLGVQIVIYFTSGFIQKKLFRFSREKSCILTCCLLYNNATMVGYPIVHALFGEDAVLMNLMLTVGMNLSFYSLGVASVKAMKSNKMQFSIKGVLNPFIVMTLIGLILFVFQIPYPTAVGESIQAIAATCMPIAMITNGAMLSRQKIIDIFVHKQIYLVVALRIVIIPIILVLVLQNLFGIKEAELLYAAAITFASPIATGVPPLIQTVNGDYTQAIQSVSLSAILSCITIPVIYAFVGCIV